MESLFFNRIGGEEDVPGGVAPVAVGVFVALVDLISADISLKS